MKLFLYVIRHQQKEQIYSFIKCVRSCLPAHPQSGTTMSQLNLMNELRYEVDFLHLVRHLRVQANWKDREKPGKIVDFKVSQKKLGNSKKNEQKSGNQGKLSEAYCESYHSDKELIKSFPWFKRFKYFHLLEPSSFMGKKGSICF